MLQDVLMSMFGAIEKLIDKKGLRLDGRKPDELRPVKIDVGILANADGFVQLPVGCVPVQAGGRPEVREPGRVSARPEAERQSVGGLHHADQLHHEPGRDQHEGVITWTTFAGKSQ